MYLAPRCVGYETPGQQQETVDVIRELGVVRRLRTPLAVNLAGDDKRLRRAEPRRSFRRRFRGDK